MDNLQEVIKNKAELIEMKKSTIKNCDPITGSPSVNKSSVVKNENTEFTSGAVILKKTIVGNTYNWMDSHEDVHIKGCFVKSIKERGPNGTNKIFHLHDHLYEITAKVGSPTSIYEQDVAWKDLGVDANGTTTALMMDTDVKKEYNERMFKAYGNNEVDNHSVGMQYVKIELAADSDEDEDAKKLWDEVYPTLGNKDEAAAKGYFFVVKEARLKEISGVLLGSNTVTPTMPNKAEEPEQSTQPEEPLKNTPIGLHDLINNFK